jgi:guanylate kinase
LSKKGLLTVISGFSGSGKGTVVNGLIEKYGYSLSISATTRKARTGEINGKHYFFKTTEEFKQMIDNNGLIEWVEYIGNYYGTPRDYVEEMLEQGKDVILEIEMQGGFKVKENYKDALLIFMTPPSAKVLRERLTGRGTEDMETINKRLHRASEETAYIDSYDYLIINDNLDECIDTINNIITIEKKRTIRNYEMVNNIKKDFSNI